MRIRPAALGVLLVVVGAAFVLWLLGGEPDAAGSGAPAALDTSPRHRVTEARPRPFEDEGPGPPASRAAASDDGGAPGDAGAGAGGTMTDLLDAVGRASVRAWLEANAEAAEKHVDAFCEQSKALAKVKALEPPPRTRDAASFLDGRADWEDGRLGTLHLAKSLTDRMNEPLGAWRRFGPADYVGLDFGWMRELLEFDHWTMLGGGPLKDLPTLRFFEAPLPNFVTLQNWVKLRLVKGVNEGDVAQATLEVRHLADLCASSGTLVGEMIRVAIHGIERKTWEELHVAPPTPPASADEAYRFRHAAFAATWFLFPGVSRAVKQKALACMPIRCAALNEAIGATATLRELVPAADEDLGWLLAQSPCEPGLARRLAKSPPAPPSELLQSWSGDVGVEHSMRQLLDGGP